mgnify:CR=1 FL=1
MQAMPVESKQRGMRWHHYLSIIIVLALFIVLPVVALLHFQEEIKQAQAYGYAGVFIVGLLCGITIIPAPTQILIFTFGHVLNPIWVGLIAGLGSATGGITVYLTGAGAQNIWSRLRNREWAFQHRLGIDDSAASLKQSEAWSKWKAFYEGLARWINGKRGSWALFITSALVISPFYPAGLAAGSLGMGLLKFFLISWAGKTVRYLSVALAGYYGLEFISRLLK